MQLKTVLDAYVECALWSSTDDLGAPLDDAYSAEDLAPEALDSMRKDVTDFLSQVDRMALEDIMTAEQFGHDFWLTRNDHGAGFWDRGYGAIGDTLSQMSKVYGTSDIIIGDDGTLYVS